MEKWFISNKKSDFNIIARQFKILPLTAKIMGNRGISTAKEVNEFLNGDFSKLHEPFEMKDMEKAIHILRDKIEGKKKIRVMQDYDADGCMAGFILMSAIGECGGTADYDVPERVTDGYGMNPRMVQAAFDEGVDTIITCDNGIAQREAASLAVGLGMTVIITDHHEVPFCINENGETIYELPNAHAIIDPKRSDCKYPFKDLCGGGIAFKVAQGLFRLFGIPDKVLMPLLQFAALATVCDIVKLTDENRIIVKLGLKELTTTQNIGMAALLRQTTKEGEEVNAGKIGFFIGPVINAGGRMETARLVMELLQSDKEETADVLAKKLLLLNKKRKEATDAAVRYIKKQGIDQSDSIIVQYMPSCHESVAGIVAGRIKDAIHKPVIVLTDSNKEGIIKGSARSVPGFDIFKRISIAREFLLGFGGHPMAAGLSLPKDNFEAFKMAINLPGWDMQAEPFKRVTIDAAVAFSHMSHELIDEMHRLEPFGSGNPKPIFAAKNVGVKRVVILGEGSKVTKLTMEDSFGTEMTGIYFGDSGEFLKSISQAFGEAATADLAAGMGEITGDFCFMPTINSYRGRETIQLEISAYRF